MSILGWIFLIANAAYPTYHNIKILFFLAGHDGGRRLYTPTASKYGRTKNNDTNTFITPRLTLPVLGSVRFHWGAEQLVMPQQSYFCKIIDISRCPSNSLALPVLFVSSLAVAIFPSLF
jgi:hypothetical protein